MAPSFLKFKELRRRSRASFRTEHSTDASSDGAVSHGTTPSSGSLTPPSIAHQSDPALNLQIKHPSSSQKNGLPPVPRRILAPGLNTNRRSVSGMSGYGSPPMNGRQSMPLSPYAPRVHNVSDNAWVSQKVILVHGTIGEMEQHPMDGTLVISRLDDSFPPISWPVCDSHFKALVYLQPGQNKIRLSFSSPKLPDSSSSNPIHVSFLTMHMVPALNAPPLHLAILLAKDSPETFDSPPSKIEREGNDLDIAIRKFRMSAYLWQAFTAEQMWRNKLGRRVFRFDEEWVTGTANHRDQENGTMRSEARIHIIRSDKTLAEIRDLNRAQQNENATDRDGLVDIAADAVNEYFKPLPGQKQYVSVLLLDSHWDKKAGITRGHLALGGNTGDLQIGVFGSHCLHSYPSTLEEVVPAFTDCTPTDTDFVANDSNESGSSWEVANIGIGAHLHETGHLLGCPHQQGGIMLRDFVVFNRTFVTREAYSTRTKSRGGPALQGDECTWHRLDCLRFRAHPAFMLPNDPPPRTDSSIQVFAAEGGKMLAMASAGIFYVEIYPGDEELCPAWIEYTAENAPIQRQVVLTERELRDRLPDAKKKDRLRIKIMSHGGGSLTIDDFNSFTSKVAFVKLPNGKVAYKSKQLGESVTDGSEPEEMTFTSAVRPERVMLRIIVYHGSALDGLEFVYDDNSTQLFGQRGGTEGGDSFDFDVRRGEYLSGLVVRAGAWIDGVQILTSMGRKSPLFGQDGGSAQTLIPPRGYTICGVAGTCGSWVDGLSILIQQ